MAATKAVHRSSSMNGSRSGILIDRLQLVASTSRREVTVPNHLLDTKIYSKVAQNSVVQARPAVVHFGGFELGQTMTQKLFIANVSTDVQRFHIIPPQTKFFNIKYTKNDRLVPGLTLDCIIEFCPEEWRYYYDCIRINCKGDDNLIIPIHAYPIMNTAHFPQHLHFAPTPVGEKRIKTLPLVSNCPVDFEFTVNVPQAHAAFKIDPCSGRIPAMGEAVITVIFSPSDFSTCQCTIQVQISQFNSKPLLCVITGTSNPGLMKELSESSQKESEDTSSSNVLDPESLSPMDRSRRKKKTKRHRITSGSGDKILEVEKNGVKFPINLNSPYAVSCVLNQEPGKLRHKDIRQAVASKESGGVVTRQMKEALFEQDVRQNVYEERQNQLRWQVRLGEDLMESENKITILEDRQSTYNDYKLKRGDPPADDEYRRSCTACLSSRTFRDYDQLASEGVRFDVYRNDPWAVKFAVLNKFAQAARAVIIRRRAQDKLDLLLDMVKDLGTRKHSMFQSSAAQKLIRTLRKGVNKGEAMPEEEVLSHDHVKSVTFPVYKSPDEKEDIEPDAVDQLEVTGTDVVVKHKVPYYDLKVPQKYTLSGYKSYNVQDSSRGYVPPGLARSLRTGAEDEIVNMTIPDEPCDNETVTVENESMQRAPTRTLEEPSLCLFPPECLLDPPDYPSLHIFNPSPGLQVYMAPLPYSETDTDFHLCPLPRYNQQNKPETIHTSTQKSYTDREDVIKGVMQWKKFPSQGLTSLSNTPTLTNVWVPRWSDPFVNELLPEQGPAVLAKLPDDDRIDEVEEDLTERVLLTPDMVAAQFSLIDRVSPDEPDKNKEDVFPLGNKMPVTNIPVSSSGPVPREKREEELDEFLNKKYNRLGERIHQKVHQLNSLKTDSTLVLE